MFFRRIFNYVFWQFAFFNYVFKNEESIIRLKDMFQHYNYPTDDICLEVYKDFKDFS
jgi:hypothetical protein